MRDRRGPFKLALAIVIARQTNGAVSDPACALASFFLQRLVERNRMAEQPGNIGTVSQLTHRPGRVPGGPGGYRVFFQEDDFLAGVLGKVICR